MAAVNFRFRVAHEVSGSGRWRLQADISEQSFGEHRDGPARTSACSNHQALRRKILPSKLFEGYGVGAIDALLLFHRIARKTAEACLHLGGERALHQDLPGALGARPDEAGVRAALLAAHGVQHAGRGQTLGVAQRNRRCRQSIAVAAAALHAVKRGGDRGALVEQLRTSFGDRHLVAVTLEA
jgi:hypothetical protein